VRWAITADQNAAVKVVIAGFLPFAWQEPGCGYQVADAAHTMNQTKPSCDSGGAAQDDLCEPAIGPYASHVVGARARRKSSRRTKCWQWHHQHGQANNFNSE
jgi:hypothetical protein